MARHKWTALGGCVENPGVHDNGNGGLIYAQSCERCGAIRHRGYDYTGHRPSNNFKWRIEEESTRKAPCSARHFPSPPPTEDELRTARSKAIEVSIQIQKHRLSRDSFFAAGRKAFEAAFPNENFFSRELADGNMLIYFQRRRIRRIEREGNCRVEILEAYFWDGRHLAAATMRDYPQYSYREVVYPDGRTMTATP